MRDGKNKWVKLIGKELSNLAKCQKQSLCNSCQKTGDLLPNFDFCICYAHYFTGFAGPISPQGGQLSQINPLKTESRAINPLTSNVQ